MLTVRYGWKFTPTRKENKAGSGERERVFSSEDVALTTFATWHNQAPSWDYWLISSRPATKAEIRASDKYRLTRI